MITEILEKQQCRLYWTNPPGDYNYKLWANYKKQMFEGIREKPKADKTGGEETPEGSW